MPHLVIAALIAKSAMIKVGIALGIMTWGSKPQPSLSCRSHA